MKTALSVLAVLTAACAPDMPLAPFHCPGTFDMRTQRIGLCPDTTAAVDILRTAGIHVDDEQLIVVMDADTWASAGGPMVAGLTYDDVIFVNASGASLAHELMHSNHRPLIDNTHAGWLENGQAAIDCFYRWHVYGAGTASWGYDPVPQLTVDQQANLEAAGYPVAEWLTSSVRLHNEET